MKNRVATIWYHRDKDNSDEIFSKLVTEEELTIILRTSAFHDIVAIQLYIGGWPLKGSGIFEHHVHVRSNGSLTHETYELACLPLQEQVCLFPNLSFN
jgi:hypothetical protein